MVKSKLEKSNLGKTIVSDSDEEVRVPKSKSGKKFKPVDESESEERGKKTSKKHADRKKKKHAESSDESEVVKKLDKKSKKKRLADSSDESEDDRKKKEKIASKKKKLAESSEEEVKKKKKKYSESSEEEQEKKSRKKKHVESSEEELKKKKKKKYVESSEEDLKKKKKKRAESSEEDLKKKKKRAESSEEDLKKKKKHAESSEEDLEKPIKSIKNQPVQKPKTSEKPRQKSPQSSAEEDLYSKPKNNPIPAAIAKPKPKTPSSSSSPSSSHSSDSGEQGLKLMKKTKEKLPKKRPEPSLKNLPVVEFNKSSSVQPVSAQENLKPTQNTQTELFIGGLAFEVTEGDLISIFSKYGTVEKIHLPLKNGSPSGIGFVSYTLPEMAEKALELNGLVIKNRPIRLSYSSKGTNSTQKSFTQVSKPSNPTSTVFVKNIPYDSTDDSIRAFFSQSGEISQIRIARLPTGELRGFCHIEFADQSGAEKAVSLTGSQLNGRPIKIEFSGPKTVQEAPKANSNFTGQKIKL